ncbi:MAG: hypothetical protein J5J06_11140 [Phycisphaerae bacterium]|nr:hypothetical protein [Phycisphaerae bacterium]
MNTYACALAGQTGRLRIAVVAWLALAAISATSASAVDVVFRDDFDAQSPLAGWSFVRERSGDWSLTSEPGYFELTTRRGTFGEDSAVSNLLVRPWEGDVRLETRLIFDPQDAQQFAGLIIYQDDTHAVALGLTYAAGDRGVFRGVAMLAVGDDIDPAAQPPVAFYDEENAANPNQIYLRLLRVGDQFVGAYSPDGVTFSDIGTITNRLSADVLVGIGGANGDYPECGSACDDPQKAAFDYFELATLDSGPPVDPPVEVALDEVRITGPTEITGGASGSFVATAYYSDGTSEDVTEAADWSLSPAGSATVTGGTLSTLAVDTDRNVTVVASYSQLTSAGEIRRIAGRVVLIRAPEDSGSPAGRGLCGTGALAMLPAIVGGMFLLGLRRQRGVGKRGRIQVV